MSVTFSIAHLDNDEEFGEIWRNSVDWDEDLTLRLANGNAVQAVRHLGMEFDTHNWCGELDPDEVIARVLLNDRPDLGRAGQVHQEPGKVTMIEASLPQGYFTRVSEQLAVIAAKARELNEQAGEKIHWVSYG